MADSVASAWTPFVLKVAGARTALLSGALLLALAGPARADALLFQHTGDLDPTTEGWTVFGPGVSTSAGPVTVDGVEAWGIDDSTTSGGSTLAYSQDLTLAEIGDAMSTGWSLTIGVRVMNDGDAPGTGSIYASFDAGATVHSMVFGSDANGDPIVVLADGMTLALEGLGSGFHSYDLRWDAEAGSADLFVDGVERVSNHGGATYNGTGAVQWGSGSSLDTGYGAFSAVTFRTPPVPEPWSLGLLAAGGIAALVQRRPGPLSPRAS